MYYTVIDSCPSCGSDHIRWIVPSSNKKEDTNICIECLARFPINLYTYQIILSENCFSSANSISS